MTAFLPDRSQSQHNSIESSSGRTKGINLLKAENYQIRQAPRWGKLPIAARSSRNVPVPFVRLVNHDHLSEISAVCSIQFYWARMPRPKTSRATWLLFSARRVHETPPCAASAWNSCSTSRESFATTWCDIHRGMQNTADGELTGRVVDGQCRKRNFASTETQK